MKQTQTLAISGMSCEMCVRHVTRALNNVPGVGVKTVDVGSAQIEYDPGEVSEAKVLDAIRDAGYEARVSG